MAPAEIPITITTTTFPTTTSPTTTEASKVGAIVEDVSKMTDIPPWGIVTIIIGEC